MRPLTYNDKLAVKKIAQGNPVVWPHKDTHAYIGESKTNLTRLHKLLFFDVIELEVESEGDKFYRITKRGLAMAREVG